MKGWFLNGFLVRRFDPAYSEGAASCRDWSSPCKKERKNGNTLFFDGLYQGPAQSLAPKMPLRKVVAEAA
jgi:hypothetical protein